MKIPPSLTEKWILTAIVTAAAVGFLMLWWPIARRAVRTGRLLARGVVYDRERTPIRYWLGFLAGLTLALILAALAVFCIASLLGLFAE